MENNKGQRNNQSNNDKLISVLPLIIAQAEKLFFNNKRKRSANDFLLQIVSVLQKPKRQKRERIMGYVDLVERYISDDFKSHFKMARATMELFIVVIGNRIVKTEGSTGRPQENIKLQCLVTIWVLANQESYRSIADRFNVSKSTVFHCLSRVCDGLNALAETVIHWPTEQEAVAIIEGFSGKKSFPGVIGAIDGSHIDIKPPKENAASYVNRKGKTSMLLQAVCDHKCLFIDCYVGFPGSVHDARVFQKSGMLQRCNEDGYFPNDSHLLGDSAYPIGAHILVPFKDNGHLTRKQVKYNIAHAATRVGIERAFGMLKGRWRRLKYLELHCTDRLPDTIMAACILHNFCILHNDTIPEEEIIKTDIHEEEGVTPNRIENRGGIWKRNYIADNL